MGLSSQVNSCCDVGINCGEDTCLTIVSFLLIRIVIPTLCFHFLLFNLTVRAGGCGELQHSILRSSSLCQAPNVGFTARLYVVSPPSTKKNSGMLKSGSYPVSFTSHLSMKNTHRCEAARRCAQAF